MKILGINISHHMSYCYMDGGVIKKFHNEERSMGIKHFYPTQLNIDKLKGIGHSKNLTFFGGSFFPKKWKLYINEIS